MNQRHNTKNTYIKALIFLVVALLYVGRVVYADITGTYALNTPGQIGSLQIDQTGTHLTGSLQLITASTTPPGYTISNSNLSGSVHGANLIIRYVGFLSNPQMFTGEIKKKSLLTINFPQPDGHLTPAKFLPISPISWNRLVSSFEFKMKRLYDLRMLYSDYQNVRTNYASYNTSLQTDLSNFNSAVESFQANHKREATAEQLLDKAVGLRNKAKAASDALTNESSDQEQQKAEINLEASDTELCNAGSALWQATDDVWQDLAKILKLRDAISSDETNLMSLFQQGQDDAAKIAFLETALKIRNAKQTKSTLNNSDKVLGKAFTKINDQVSTLMPKPQSAISGQGTVISEYAVVRNCQLYGDSSHSNVKVLLTMTKGQTIHHIKEQTYNDYIVELSDGTLGMIPKADVEVTAETAK